MRKEFPAQSKLHDMITAAGIQASHIPYGFFLPLVMVWCQLPEPFDLTQSATGPLLDEFAKAIIDGRSVSRYRDAIVGLGLSRTPVELEKGVAIRTIEEDELWDLTSGSISSTPFSLQLSPSDDWSMLDIELDLLHVDAPRAASTLYVLREALLANLVLAVTGGFTVLPIGITARFGPNATGTTTHGSRMPREFGQFPHVPTTAIDTNARQELQELWPRVEESFLSASSYLSLPLRRLVDARGRTRVDDKIVDCAIALEALLTGSEKQELKYRLALRGATVLEEQGEDKHQAFKELRDFYDVRSRIVHGASVKKYDLPPLAKNGERLLREILKWHLTQGLTRRGATDRIDRRILGSA
jgi:hypothetical protein